MSGTSTVVGLKSHATAYHQESRLQTGFGDRFADRELEFKLIDRNEDNREAKVSCSFFFCVDAAKNLEICETLLNEC